MAKANLSALSPAQRNKLALRIRQVKTAAVARDTAHRPRVSLQLFQPDTCGCCIIQFKDKEQRALGRPWKTLDHMAFKCPAHDQLTDVECYECIHGTGEESSEKIDSEQRRWMAFVRLAADADDGFGELSSQPTDAVDPVTNRRVMNTTRAPRRDVEFVVRFTGTGMHRKMEVTGIGIPWTAERQATCDAICAALPGDNEAMDGATFLSRA